MQDYIWCHNFCRNVIKTRFSRTWLAQCRSAVFYVCVISRSGQKSMQTINSPMQHAQENKLDIVAAVSGRRDGERSNFGVGRSALSLDSTFPPHRIERAGVE
jgi:hypothetical protein